MATIPQDINDRLRRLEQELRALTTAANRRPALNQIMHGDVKIGEGGGLSVKQPGGAETFRVGEVGPIAGEHALVVRRRDGSVALSVWNGTTTGGQAQAFRIKDAQGHELLSEDVVAGGLARPHLPIPMSPAQPTNWPSTSSTSWTDLQVAWPEAQHPRLEVFAQAVGNGNGGDMRITVDGQVMASGTHNKPIQATFKIPNYEFGQHPEIKLQARAKTSSTVWACVQRMCGVAS
ncbi:hypothetical protein [Streptomyces natalensis]|uniref:Uncharacterized protein n=1 Tax=Streptomyces natalensis ATCC 27448 TaxID=1240678 RepID=A0A0D7CMB6_9ACTN|nr:hypothetical protein [Streptomyces natalensis]KIZ17323.1 hypothetical protein SNA_14985 [Streptomyces natalensis ATCC 27448]